MSAKCKQIFSSIKHLIINSCNHFKADIIEANECLKSWFKRLEAKAFAKGINPNVNEQYKEEDHDIGDEDLDKDLDEDLGKNLDKKNPKGEAVKYTVLDN